MTTFKAQSHYPVAVTENFSVNFTCYHYINKDNHTDLVKKLADGTLFLFENPQTKEVTPIPYPCLFEDTQKQYMVIFMPEHVMALNDVTPSLFEGASPDVTDFTIRLCTNIQDFLEKINILDSQLIDTEFECVRLLTHTLLTEQHQISEPSFLFFHEENNKHYISVFSNDTQQLVDYNPELVSIVHSRIGDKLHLPKGHVHCVDRQFAIDALELN